MDSIIIEINNQINKKYIMKKTEINYYKNKTITETKEIQNLKTYLNPMLIYKTN